MFVKSVTCWAILFSVWAYFDNEIWSALQDFVIPLLSIVMFAMGLTLKIKDFYKIFKNLKIVFLGIFLQFLLMPAIGYFLISIFDIETIIAVGILLVGCAPGGTASNVPYCLFYFFSNFFYAEFILVIYRKQH